MVDQGISEDEAWCLFLQIVDALADMILFFIIIFADFGLATLSLAAVAFDVSLSAVTLDADMTLGNVPLPANPFLSLS